MAVTRRIPMHMNKGKNQPRFIRLSSLEEGYTEADLHAHFLGQQEHKPREKRNHRTDVCPFNFVIDIQSKLQNKGVDISAGHWFIT